MMCAVTHPSGSPAAGLGSPSVVDMEILCAACGCLVERGEIVTPCAKHPDCCCGNLSIRPAGQPAESA